MSQEWLEAISHLGTDWHKPHLEEAPLSYRRISSSLRSVAIRTPKTDEEIKVKHYYSEESVGIAVGILLTSLHLAGLATLTHTPSPDEVPQRDSEPPTQRTCLRRYSGGLSC